MKKLLKILGIFIFFLALAALGLKLFAPKLLTKGLESFKSRLQPAIIEDYVLSIVYSDDVTSLEPTSYNVPNRKRLLNIYEGLIAIDRDLKVQPALALSWGIIDPVTWEFTLRPDVKFHDGSDLDPKDVETSIDRAAHFLGSELSSFTNTIEKVEVVSDSKIRLITSKPDPILLNKLAAIFIFPSELKDSIAEKPVGTAAYQFKAWEKGKSFDLELFSDYWGEKPRYRYISIRYIPDKDERLQALLKGKIDVLGNVPFASLSVLKSNNIPVLMQPSLEVNFLVFDHLKKEENLFSNHDLRLAVAASLDKEEIGRFMGEFAKPVDQFVSRGIFGFTEGIKAQPFDIKIADELARTVESFTRLSVDLDLANGLEVFGNYVKEQLFKIGLDVNLNYLDAKELQAKIESGQSHFFFLGWRSELGDVSDFYQALVHSRDKDSKYGQYNAGIYKNEKVDQLIEESEKIVDDPAKRLEKLQDVMKILVEEDIFGVPLFETEVLFAKQKKIDWKPRVDGYVLAKEIK